MTVALGWETARETGPGLQAFSGALLLSMNPSRHILATVALLLAGCATAPPLTTPVGHVPDLKGAWTGTWGGAPLTLLVLEQEDESASGGGVSLGPWLLLGDRLPGVSGVLTYTVHEDAVSVNVKGRLGDWNGKLTLVLDPATTNGAQITLTHVDERRLAGTGTSRARWEPQGAVELVRQGAARPAGARP